jgi:predicted  nucleic acid-binding Zn-ribbon protein
VRCPQCGYTGEGKEFLHGCPSCGYSGTGFRGEGGRRRAREEWYDADDLSQMETEPRSRRSRREARERGEGPPGWVWWLAIGLLSLTFLIMVIIYVRLS